MNEDQARAVFLLAGLPVTSLYRLENGYWPDAYVEMKAKSPWWLGMTEYGPIRIGWRKRVIEIVWTDIPVRIAALTTDNVTKWDCGVHAYSYGHAVDYLSQLRTLVGYSQGDLSDEDLLRLHGMSRVKVVA